MTRIKILIWLDRFGHLAMTASFANRGVSSCQFPDVQEPRRKFPNDDE